MNIGIFETEHFEASYPVIKLVDDKQNHLTIFTYESSYRQFQYLFDREADQYDWIVKPGKKSKYAFIIKMFKEVRKRKLSVLYLNTISNNFIVYAIMVLFLRRVRVILTIHNINTWFAYKKSFSFRRIIRYMGRKLLLLAIKEFNVLGLTMVDTLKVKLPQNKNVHCLPGAVFEENRIKQTQPDITTQVNIVIPGTIDGRRRDYQEAFDLLVFLEKEAIPVTMTFLGKFYEGYGLNILQQSKAWPKGYTQLKYYEFETVDQPEFDKIMNEASFVFTPSVLTTIIEDGVREIYGTTISSGNLFDVVRHSKPFIIPEKLQVDHFLEKSCYRYKNPKDIAQFISSLYNQPGLYTKLLQSALEASRNYTIEKVRKRNASLFNA